MKPSPAATDQTCVLYDDIQVSTVAHGVKLQEGFENGLAWTQDPADLAGWYGCGQMNLIANATGAPDAWKWDVIYAGGRAIAEVDADGIHELHTDHLGTPRIITSGTTGRVEGRQAYAPYGERIDDPQWTHGYQPLTGYTGHIQTEATGLIYMRGRTYSPAWHRFLNSDQGADPLSLNQFAYVGGSPMHATDPSGMAMCLAGYQYVVDAWIVDQPAGGHWEAIWFDCGSGNGGSEPGPGTSADPGGAPAGDGPASNNDAPPKTTKPKSNCNKAVNTGLRPNSVGLKLGTGSAFGLLHRQFAVSGDGGISYFFGGGGTAWHSTIGGFNGMNKNDFVVGASAGIGGGISLSNGTQGSSLNGRSRSFNVSIGMVGISFSIDDNATYTLDVGFSKGPFGISGSSYDTATISGQISDCE